MSKVQKIPCNVNNYNPWKKRDLRSIKGIVLHYTANDGDTAVNNGLYFQRETVYASAHYFIDRKGVIVKSVPYSNIAWAVETKGMPLKGLLNNSNTISIELCDFNKNRTISKKQKESLEWLIKYLQKRCVNATEIVRHYDICGKLCPKNLIDESKWKKFKEDLNI